MVIVALAKTPTRRPPLRREPHRFQIQTLALLPSFSSLSPRGSNRQRRPPPGRLHPTRSPAPPPWPPYSLRSRVAVAPSPASAALTARESHLSGADPRSSTSTLRSPFISLDPPQLRAADDLRCCSVFRQRCPSGISLLPFSIEAYRSPFRSSRSLSPSSFSGTCPRAASPLGEIPAALLFLILIRRASTADPTPTGHSKSLTTSCSIPPPLQPPSTAAHSSSAKSCRRPAALSLSSDQRTSRQATDLISRIRARSASSDTGLALIFSPRSLHCYHTLPLPISVVHWPPSFRSPPLSDAPSSPCW